MLILQMDAYVHIIACIYMYVHTYISSCIYKNLTV